MTAGDFEQDKVSKSASVETLKSGGSNVCWKKNF